MLDYEAEVLGSGLASFGLDTNCTRLAVAVHLCAAVRVVGNGHASAVEERNTGYP
jgi:hypothetical protein